MDAARSPSQRATPAALPRYSLLPARLPAEDIILCVDVGAEVLADMRPGAGVSRLDAVRQAVLLFCHAKLAASPDHRFAFAAVGKSVTWVKKEFSNDISAAVEAVKSLASVDSSSGVADITKLFRVAAREARRSRSQGRLLRVVLIYCRSSVFPHYEWPLSQKVFTMDVVYLHDKPGPENCPQKVFDALVDALELVSEYEGYILESGQGLPRVLFRHMCILLSHPVQRCVQDDIDYPKSLTREAPAGGKESGITDESLPSST